MRALCAQVRPLKRGIFFFLEQFSSCLPANGQVVQKGEVQGILLLHLETVQEKSL